MAQRHQPFLPSLPQQDGIPVAQIHPGQRKSHQFRNTAACGIEEFQDGPVPAAQDGGAVRHPQQEIDFEFFQKHRQLLFQFGGPHPGKGVGLHPAFPPEIPVEGPQGGNPPGNGPPGQVPVMHLGKIGTDVQDRYLRPAEIFGPLGHKLFEMPDIRQIVLDGQGRIVLFHFQIKGKILRPLFPGAIRQAAFCLFHGTPQIVRIVLNSRQFILPYSD